VTPREELTELIRESMALCKRVAAGLAAGPGYQPPEPEEEDR
jgi:hypothetical protein